MLTCISLVFCETNRAFSQETAEEPKAETKAETGEEYDPNDEPGMDFLNQATEKKITARNLDDLGQVIRLCEQAKQKGLSKDNEEYCDQLRASSQMQRGLVTGRIIVEIDSLPPDWETVRHTALADLEDAVRVIPDNPQAYFYIARLNLLPGGDADRVKTALDTTIEKAADDDVETKIKAILIQVVLEENQEKKLERLDQALEVSPKSIPVLLAAGAYFAEVKRYDRAVECMNTVLEQDPSNTTALGALVEIYTQEKKHDKALEQLETLEKLLPNEVGLMVERARIFSMLEKNDEALEVLEKARAKDPRNPVVLMIRASIYLSMKDYEKAGKDINALYRLNLPPERFQLVRRLRVDYYVQQEKYASALKLIDQMIADTEYDIDLKIWKAMILSAKKANSQALAILEELLKRPQEEFRDRDYFNALRALGDVHLNLGSHSAATSTYKKAMAIDPEDPGLLNNYSWLLSTSPVDAFRDGELALEFAKKAAEKTDYKQAHILSTLGAAYAENLNFDEALKWAEKAVQLGEKEKHERVEDLKKELESYKKKEPWRERHEEDTPFDYENAAEEDDPYIDAAGEKTEEEAKPESEEEDLEKLFLG